MVGPEGDCSAFADHALRWRAPDTEVGLQQPASHDADRSGGDVVVVPACVVPGRPADEPDVYVLISMDGGVVSPAPGVSDLVAPQIRAVSQVRDEVTQLALPEVPGR